MTASRWTACAAALAATAACTTARPPEATVRPARVGPPPNATAAPAPSPAAMTATAIAGPQAMADRLWLDRLTWGADESDWQALQKLGRSAWLEQQLHPGPVAALPGQAQARLDAMTVGHEPLAQLSQDLKSRREAADRAGDDAARQAAHKALQQQLESLTREASTRMLLRAVASPQQLREQMTWFWFNHFNVHANKGALRAAVGDYEDALRAHALGHFRDLLRASAFHPAMLAYLDNARNTAGHINENYARELLELHTLGVDGGYTQQDVQELARVLTGLGVGEGRMEFHARRHDRGTKRLLGQAVRGGGLDEIEQVLDRLARHPATARHVSLQIARYFVADAPPAALVERMSRRFLETDGDIAEVLRTMVASPEFEASLGHRFKDPLHYVVSTARLACADPSAAEPGPMLDALRRLGELPYRHPTPDGYPLDTASWSGAGQMTTRFDIARAVGTGAAPLCRTPDVPAAQAVPRLDGAFFRVGMEPLLSAATRQALSQAAGPKEWNTLLLASPEFMNR